MECGDDGDDDETETENNTDDRDVLIFPLLSRLALPFTERMIITIVVNDNTRISVGNRRSRCRDVTVTAASDVNIVVVRRRRRRRRRCVLFMCVGQKEKIGSFHFLLAVRFKVRVCIGQ